MAHIVPVYKKESKINVENYRPISLTSLVMKIFEKCLHDHILKITSEKIYSTQHGFLPGKSCVTQMIPFVDDLGLNLHKKSITDVIYFDYSKAFDSVSHDIKLKKLKTQYQIDGLLLAFLKDYLEGRKQLVVIEGEQSDTMPVLSGIPQGSILGPLIFVLFINDLNDAISENTNISLYADDTKIWREIISYEDHLILQNDINSMYKWSIENKMKFHPKKCKVLQVTLKLECYMYVLPFTRFPYHLNDEILNYVPYEKDLGVIINNKLKWNSHCIQLMTKANQRLGLVRRTLFFMKNSTKRRVFYISLIRSIFDHCS